MGELNNDFNRRERVQDQDKSNMVIYIGGIILCVIAFLSLLIPIYFIFITFLLMGLCFIFLGLSERKNADLVNNEKYTIIGTLFGLLTGIVILFYYGSNINNFEVFYIILFITIILFIIILVLYLKK